MKTVMLCNIVPSKMGAFEKLSVEISRAFKTGGDEVVFAFSGPLCAELENEFQDLFIRAHIIPEWCDTGGRERPWGFIKSALQILGKEKPDVIGIHFGNELPALALAMRLKVQTGHSCKWIWQQQQQIADPTSFFTRHLSRIRLLSLGFDHFVPVYEGGKMSLLKRGIPPGKITTITNATTDYNPQMQSGWLRKQLSIPSDVVLAVTVGSLIARKRIDFLLRVLSMMSRDIPRMHLIVAGSGPDKDALATLAGSLGVSERVHWMGRRNNVREILADCDIMVHSATAEASAFSILEGMVAGLPVIVTAAGAAKEQVEDGINGFVVGLTDEDLFVDRLRLLVKDQALRRRMGAVGRERWERFYRLEAAAEQYHALYRKVAGI